MLPQPHDLHPRGAAPRLRALVASRRVVVVSGPRQAGKTTLVRQLLDELGRGTLRRLDDPALRQAAVEDPLGFARTGQAPIVIDEVQRAGDPLVQAVKLRVDEDPTPGQYVLTGSSNFLTVPAISESLAGRAAFVDLWPLTQGELAGVPEQFVDLLFEAPERLRALQPEGLSTRDYLERLCAGGYPEVQRLEPAMRVQWFADYVRTLVQRDIVELSGIRKVEGLRQLLRLFAARTGEQLVMERVIRESQLERQAVYDHRAWLTTAHLVHLLPAWSRNPTRRATAKPKLLITDPGLAAWLLGKDAEALSEPAEPTAGQLVETFVAVELLRQLTWARTPATLSHWRDRSGAEVDLVLESTDGRTVAIEVKKSASANGRWFASLALLRDRLDEVGGDFVHGVVLYTGTQVLPFGDRLTALPVSALWSA